MSIHSTDMPIALKSYAQKMPEEFPHKHGDKIILPEFLLGSDAWFQIMVRKTGTGVQIQCGRAQLIDPVSTPDANIT